MGSIHESNRQHSIYNAECMKNGTHRLRLLEEGVELQQLAVAGLRGQLLDILCRLGKFGISRATRIRHAVGVCRCASWPRKTFRKKVPKEKLEEGCSARPFLCTAYTEMPEATTASGTVLIRYSSPVCDVSLPDPIDAASLPSNQWLID